MKYVKMLSLAAMAVMALMAFASSASATTLDNASGALPEKTEIAASLSGGTATLETLGGTVLDTCTGGEVKGTTSNNGKAATVEGALESLTWTGCTKTTDNVKLGKLEVSNISGTNNGTLSTNGTEVTINTIFGSCVYGSTGPLDLGTVVAGSPATLAINTIVPKISGNLACPSESRWTANYTVTTPSTLKVTS